MAEHLLVVYGLALHALFLLGPWWLLHKICRRQTGDAPAVSTQRIKRRVHPLCSDSQAYTFEEFVEYCNAKGMAEGSAESLWANSTTLLQDELGEDWRAVAKHTDDSIVCVCTASRSVHDVLKPMLVRRGIVATFKRPGDCMTRIGWRRRGLVVPLDGEDDWRSLWYGRRYRYTWEIDDKR